MLSQLSPRADKELNSLSRTIAQAKRMIDSHQKIHDTCWEVAANLLREFGKERFIASDGQYLALQSRERQPKLDEAALERAIRATCKTKAAADAIWAQVTDRKVNPEKLEALIARGRLPASVLEECLQPNPPSVARIQQPWTKEDETRAEVFGVEKEVPETNLKVFPLE